MVKTEGMSPAVRIPLAGVAAWLVPGLGQIVAGDRKRGLIIMVTIAVTFWGGIAIGGVRSTIDPQRKKLWFMAQVCGGGHAMVALVWGQQSRKGLTADRVAYAQWNSTEVAMVYTGVAGLLNLLAIMDALVRVDPSWREEHDFESPSAAGAA